MVAKTLVNDSLLDLFRRDIKTKVFFLHFPKCGGTSINRAIENSFGYFEKRNFFHLSPHASAKASKVAEDELMDYREKILLYYMSNSGYRYISGHFQYSQKAFEEFGKEWYFVTILRDPVSKWFSHYFFNKYKEDSHFKIEDNIEDFLESERATALGCDYVSKLVGETGEIDYTSENAIKAAINNLHKFKLVGVIEDTDSFAKKYHDLFGAKLLIKRKNTNPRSKAKQQEEITDRVKNKVKEICKPNLRVYESVLEQIKAD